MSNKFLKTELPNYFHQLTPQLDDSAGACSHLGWHLAHFQLTERAGNLAGWRSLGWQPSRLALDSWHLG